MVFRGNRILTLGFHDPYWGSIVYAQIFQVPKSFWGYILQDAEELEYILGKELPSLPWFLSEDTAHPWECYLSFLLLSWLQDTPLFLAVWPKDKLRLWGYSLKEQVSSGININKD